MTVILPSTAAAKGRVSASYGVLGKRTVHATAVVTGVRGKARVLLETRNGPVKTTRRVRHRRT